MFTAPPPLMTRLVLMELAPREGHRAGACCQIVARDAGIHRQGAGRMVGQGLIRPQSDAAIERDRSGVRVDGDTAVAQAQCGAGERCGGGGCAAVAKNEAIDAGGAVIRLAGVAGLVEAGDVGAQIAGRSHAPDPVTACGPSGGCRRGTPVQRGGRLHRLRAEHHGQDQGRSTKVSG